MVRELHATALAAAGASCYRYSRPPRSEEVAISFTDTGVGTYKDNMKKLCSAS